MKKQTNHTKAKQTKMSVAMTHAVVRHNRWQSFWGIVALVGLFLCGMFVGMSMNSSDKDAVAAQSDVASATMPAMETINTTETTTTESEPVDVCVEIERLMLRHLPDATDDAEDRIDRAKIYAKLSERGCPENSAAYVDMARSELEIARAIEDDEFDHEETIEVVETYKRLNMQAAAEEIFEKAKKLTSPAIDFILQVEKIINE